MAEVDVADDAELLEVLERAVDRGAVAARGADRVGRERGVGGEQRLEHAPARGGEAPAGLAQRARDVVDVAELQRRAARGARVTATGGRSSADQRSSMRPKRQTASASAQVATNRPTIA